MYLVSFWFVCSRALGSAVLVLYASAFAHAATTQPETRVAAFLQPDLTTGKMPLSAVRVRRQGVLVASTDSLQPCDEIEFVVDQSSYSEVRVTGLRGGQSVVISAANLRTTVGCAEPTLNVKLTTLWKAISGESRGVTVTAAATRGGESNELTLPVFAGDDFSLAAGRRALVVPWAGGTKPVKVELMAHSVTKADYRVLGTVTEKTGQFAVLPMIDLTPGRYVVRVTLLADDCISRCALEETGIYVRDAVVQPKMPLALARADLSAAERALLYSYYLEGLGDEWVFEAVQQAHPYRADSLVSAWLAKFSE